MASEPTTDEWDRGRADLADHDVSIGSLVDALHSVSDVIVRTVPGAELAGITLVDVHRARTAAYADDGVLELDQAQYRHGSGPGVSALEHGVIERIDDTSHVGPWPQFREAASRHGVRSTISMPLELDGASIGALNLYSRRPAAFPPGVEDLAEPFVGQAARSLDNSRAFEDVRRLSERLRDAMAARSIIEQAKGIFMATYRVDADAAYEMLVRASQRENSKLREIAQRIVASTVAGA